jgi:hypothetical protein
MFDSSLPPVVCRNAHVLFTLFVCLHIMVSNTYCVVFLFCFSSSCCQFLRIVHFWLFLRYSLKFINHNGRVFCENNIDTWSNCYHSDLPMTACLVTGTMPSGLSSLSLSLVTLLVSDPVPSPIFLLSSCVGAGVAAPLLLADPFPLGLPLSPFLPT